jgi:hypothetical protein
LVEHCSPWLAVSPCLPWPWGFFLWRSKMRGREMMEVYVSGFAEHQGAILLAVRAYREWWLAGVH